jgi:hypothetical protein
VAVARQRHENNNSGMVFSMRFAKQQLNSNRGTAFFVRSVPICYKQDNCSVELVAGESPASKNVCTEAEDIVGIRHQAKMGEDTAD